MPYLEVTGENPRVVIGVRIGPQQTYSLVPVPIGDRARASIACRNK